MLPAPANLNIEARLSTFPDLVVEPAAGVTAGVVAGQGESRLESSCIMS